MDEVYDERHHPDRRKTDHDNGTNIYPGRRKNDVAARAHKHASEFQAVLENGATGITVQGHLIICITPSEEQPARTISEVMRQLADNETQSSDC